MRSFLARGAVLLTSLFVAIAQATPETAPQLNLPEKFAPPPVFKNTNLLRNIDLTKPYQREVIAVVVENISKEPQTDYYIPFDKEVAERISYIEARDKAGVLGFLDVAKAQSPGPTQWYRVFISEPVKAGEQITLHIAIGLTGVVEPVPAEINQVDRQYLKWTGTQYSRSAYVTGKQKTKIKLINNEVPDYTQLEPKSDGSSDPAKLGSTITYGPYEEVTPAQLGGDVISLRYEYTLPVITADTFSREIEVSHWGGNLAIEEKYALTNTGAKLKDNFNRVKWTATNYLNPPTAAIKSLTYGLTNFPLNPYYTDEIGNVSTSRFRQEQKPGEAHLELKPRYPLFGGWNYSYTLGWNHDLRNFVRQRGSSGNYVLRVPFMEGPKEPMVYKDVSVTVILPEGATDVAWYSPLPILSEERFFHKTFMDTLGRTAIKLRMSNVVDELQGRELRVSYNLSPVEFYRKPYVIFSALSALFLVSWVVAGIDVRIGPKKEGEEGK